MREHTYLGEFELMVLLTVVSSKLGAATPERGGRAKRFFRVTEQGLRSLHETRDVLRTLWRSLPAIGEGTA